MDDKTANDERRNESMQINYSDYITLEISFINSDSEERVRVAFRHDPDGAVMEVWVTDEQGRNHTFFNTCFLG
jgi:hypothetical protein